ncbi:DcaP family trimeric outer membrane transporter [Anaeromyxobacter paludicola]|uniref:Porin n=1 Tax=Anaeromyxobacter paludicola TaxID=2918171 RepID=A0ABM7XF32_9BACT|nr:DcaP family trimeric outer membrane transporter [Anaeromyxobacter paludicola]BDG10463.1 porin [Anaeromyxobacter paludicola]
MRVTRTLGGACAAAALLLGSPALAADPAPSQDDLRAEVKKLRAELDALKAQKAPAPEAQAGAEEGPSVADRLDLLEIKQKDAVVAGDIPNSFRIPGTETSLHLYGFAELNYVHEFRGDNADIDYSTFAPYLPLYGSAESERKGRDYLTARTSRVGIDASTPTKFGPLVIKIEGDFNNEPRTGGTDLYGSVKDIYTQQATSSYGFRIRHAYGVFAGLLAGETWSTFMDVDNSPETVDYNGPIGATFIRQAQLRYTYATPTWGNFTVALENSDAYALDQNLTPTTAGFSRLPDLIARWDGSFDWGTMSARALTHEIRVQAGNSAQAASYRGYGVAATALVKMRDNQDYLSLGVTYGDGIGRYMNYIEGAFYDPNTNRVIVEQAIGAVVGYQFKPTDWVRFNLVGGFTRNFDNEYTTYAAANGLDSGRFGINRMVRQVHFGPIFTPVRNIDLGVEGIWGDRETLKGEKGDMARLNFSAKYYIF